MNIGAPEWSLNNKLFGVGVDDKSDILECLFYFGDSEICTESLIEIRKGDDDERLVGIRLIFDRVLVKKGNLVQIFDTELFKAKLKSWNGAKSWLTLRETCDGFRENTMGHLGFAKIIKTKSG